MTFRFSQRAFRVCLLIALLSSFAAPVSAQSSDVGQILARINALRTQNGLPPLELNGQLTASAQQHSDDMARTGNVDHTGSDGSSIDSRIRASGYGHWRSFGIWGENIYGGQLANVDAAWNFWINSQVHRANLLNPRYREIGIGVGQSDNGTYYTLNFGAQPNVLPFFVTGSAPIMTLLLTNEDDITTGEGVAIMGQATQVRVAEGDDTSSAGWQPWAPTISFQLSDAPGQHTITVEYKDDLGRGTKALRTINVSELAANPTSTPTATATEVTPTVTLTPSATATGEATATPTLASTQSLTGTVTATPTSTATATPTATALPTETPTLAATSTPPPASTPTPQPTPAAATTAPTATSTPVASPTPRVTITAQLIAANLATYPAASRLTPPAPRPALPERPLLDDTPSPISNLFAVLLGLQAVALIGIGVIVVVRMRRRS
jgi:uncharacterized protein YkwD